MFGETIREYNIFIPYKKQNIYLRVISILYVYMKKSVINVDVDRVVEKGQNHMNCIEQSMYTITLIEISKLLKLFE